MAEDEDAESEARLRAAILRHLHRYPLAGDTPDGIVACWVPRAGFGDAARRIGSVIDTMVAAGELVEQRLPDGRMFYRKGSRV